jgi:putative ABC transport system permease protein
MRKLLRDAWYCARMLVRNPEFVLVAALVLGIGVDNAIPRLVYSILPRSLPLHDQLSPSMVWEKPTHTGRVLILPVRYPDSKNRNHLFGDTAAVVNIFPMNLGGSDEPEELVAAAVRADFFRMIGVEPVIGRDFQPRRDTRAGHRVVILSHDLWQRRFASEATIVGKTIMLDGERHRVIGILPADFAWNNRQTDVWVPYLIGQDRDSSSTSGRYMSAVSRPIRPVRARLTPAQTWDLGIEMKRS